MGDWFNKNLIYIVGFGYWLFISVMAISSGKFLFQVDDEDSFLFLIWLFGIFAFFMGIEMYRRANKFLDLTKQKDDDIHVSMLLAVGAIWFAGLSMGVWGAYVVF